MLIYNTTFQVDDDVHDNFLIWIKESYIPEVQKHGALKTPRICRILSHREEGSAYSLQWEVESSGLLHRWHLEQGVRLNDELTKIFKDKVIGSSPIRSTYKRFKSLIFRAFSFSLMALLPTQKALYLYYFNSIHPPFPNKLN